MGQQTIIQRISRQRHFSEDRIQQLKKVIVENGHAKGVLVSHGSSTERINADVVVLSAGGIGTAQILRASDLPVQDNLWVDVVLTVGGVSQECQNAKRAAYGLVHKRRKLHSFTLL